MHQSILIQNLLKEACKHGLLTVASQKSAHGWSLILFIDNLLSHTQTSILTMRDSLQCWPECPAK